MTYHVGGKGISIIDCIYVKNEGVFLAILSNSTIVTIPKNATNNSEYVISDWPIQPFKLYQLQNGTIVLICEGGWLCKVRFENGLIAQIPSM